MRHSGISLTVLANDHDTEHVDALVISSYLLGFEDVSESLQKCILATSHRPHKNYFSRASCHL